MVEVCSSAAVVDDDPLPLSQLKERVTSKTYHWLQDEERKHSKWLLEEAEVAQSSNTLFFDSKEKSDNEDEEEEIWLRVKEWSSSSRKPDGIGGYNVEQDSENSSQQQNLEEEENVTSSSVVRVKYILSSAGGGHGDDLWAASRHIANIFSNAEKCRDLLSPLRSHSPLKVDNSGDHDDEKDDSPTTHPLMGLRFVELGAGGGVPSWTAMWCGARVVCTDQSIPDRIRCIAESAERNRMAMGLDSGVDKDIVKHAQKARACPYDWGTSIREVALILCEAKEEVRFDVVVAADCIYMPQFHAVLLESIHKLLSDRGVALLPFALHGNTKDDNVWSIVDLAKQKGFQVDELESQQLTPQAHGMDTKRAFVHMLRLTKKRS